MPRRRAAGSHEKCTATAKTTKRRCTNWPIKGGRVCRMHGGSAGQVRRAAERREVTRAVEADAAAVLASEGVEPLTDPVGELERLAAGTRQDVNAAAARVNALDDIRYVSVQGAEQTRAEVLVWERAKDRHIKIVTELAKYGLDERRTEVQERLAEQFGQALDAILTELELTEEQQARLPEVAGRHLRALRGGAA